jgi:hypothetical protein
MGRETHPIPVVNGVDQETYPQDFLYVQTSIETSPMNINTAMSSLQVVSTRLSLSFLVLALLVVRPLCCFANEDVWNGEFVFV